MIEVHTFGAAGLRRDGADLRSVLSQPKRFALLVNLTLGSPSGFTPRDTLLARFWPDSDDERARNSLRQALHQLRRALGDDVITGRGDDVGVDSGLVWCDAADFERALAEGRPEDALEVYRGDFLPGFFVEGAPDVEAWIDDRRRTYRRAANRAAVELAEREEAAGSLRAAALWARRALAIEPLDEVAARRLMEVLSTGGETVAALAAYDALASQTRAELGIDPSAETRALADAIRAAATPATPEVRVPVRAVPAAPREPRASDDVALPPLHGAGRGAVARKLSPPVIQLAAAAIVLLLVVAGWQARRVGPTLDGPPAVAVLPFANLSGDGAHDYLADAVAEEVMSVLGRVPGLRVAARSSSFSFRGRDAPADSVGRALGVTHLVEGTVRIADARVRINVDLIDAASGFRVWNSSYERTVHDMMGMQAEIARAIAKQLQVELSPAVARPPADETKDAEAYRLVLQGTQTMRSGSNRQTLGDAAALFGDAVRRDPQYARALAGLANVLSWQASYRYIDADSGYARARELAERSLASAPTVEAHLVLARDAELVRQDTAAADAHFRLALELNPADPRSLQFRALFLSRNGRTDEGIVLARRAVELDPLHPGSHNNLAVVLRDAGRLDEAHEAYEEALRVSPEDPIILENLANLMSRMERYDDALAYLERALARMPDDIQTLALRANIMIRSGRRNEGLALLREYEARRDFPRYRLAILYTNLGDVDRVLDLLEEAVERGEDNLLALRNPTMFTGLRDHPRFVALLKRIGA
jgi:DNA-binding SARP family transcriptional activator/TolB-like protein/tetratricopeptide (TPR) repeat protein